MALEVLNLLMKTNHQSIRGLDGWMASPTQ